MPTDERRSTETEFPDLPIETLWQVFESLSAQIYFKDTKHRLIYVNPACRKALGLEDPLGKTDEDFLDPSVATKTREDEDQILKTGQATNPEEELDKWLDGRPQTWVRTQKVPLYENGTVIGIAGKTEDSESKRQATFYEAMLDGDRDLIFAKDSDHKLRYVNKAYADLFETTKEKIVGKGLTELGLDPSDVRRWERDDDEALVEGEKEVPRLAVTDRRTGRVRLFRTTKVRIGFIPGSSDPKPHLVGVATDITELEELRDRQARDHVDLSHQLKGPIVQCGLRLQRLTGVSSLRPDLRKELQRVRGLTRKVWVVANSLDLLASLASGKTPELKLTRLTPDLARQRLIEAADDNQVLFEDDSGVLFDVHRSTFDLLQRRLVDVDLNLFLQAVGAVLDNAGKYGFDRSTVSIRGENVGQPPGFNVVVTSIGIPILKSEVSYVKRRNWRGDHASSVTGQGSGMGLWIVENIMKAHYGTLHIGATNAKGETQVSLRFPARS